MEKDGFFSWQSDPHGTASAVEMNNSSNNKQNSSNNRMIDESQSSAGMIMATSSLLNLNWEQSSTEQTCDFESALSSLVSSPTSSNLNFPSSSSADSIVIRELIGRLGSICNNSAAGTRSGVGGATHEEISLSHSHFHSSSTNTSCYSTPLNSPRKPLSLAMIQQDPQFQSPTLPHHPIPFASDPGFAERAARFSCFGAMNNTAQLGQREPGLLQEPGKLSRVSSSHSLKAMAAPATPDVGIGVQPLMMTPSGSEGHVRKRKAPTPSSNNTSHKGGNTTTTSSRGGRGGGGGKEAAPADPPKAAEDEGLTSKRCKSASVTAIANGADKDTTAVATARTTNVEKCNTSSGSGQRQNLGKDRDREKGKDNNEKPPEPPKQDYIHVRARRGQATDSHSLAERV